MTPLVSVVIDTYNHERFIEDAIRSALDQDFPRAQIEILVVDDGSTDRTPEIVRKFEPQVRLLRKPNGGQASAINYGVANSKGEFVAFLDGDDVWLPNKLSRVIAEFEKRPETVLVYHKFCFWDSADGATWVPEYFRPVSGNILTDRRKLLTFLASPTSSLVFRRGVLERLAPIPEQCSFMHDIYLVATVICLGPVAAIDECLTRNRVHGQNLCFADRGTPNPEVLRNRVKLWDVAIRCASGWIRANTPRRSLPQVRILFRRWRIVRDFDESRLRPLNRFRRFVNACRLALLEDPTSRAHLAYCLIHAFTGLIVGKHAHYLEGFRARANKVRERLHRRASAERASESAGPIL